MLGRPARGFTLLNAFVLLVVVSPTPTPFVILLFASLSITLFSLSFRLSLLHAAALALFSPFWLSITGYKVLTWSSMPGFLMAFLLLTRVLVAGFAWRPTALWRPSPPAAWLLGGSLARSTRPSRLSLAGVPFPLCALTGIFRMVIRRFLTLVLSRLGVRMILPMVPPAHLLPVALIFSLVGLLLEWPFLVNVEPRWKLLRGSRSLVFASLGTRVLLAPRPGGPPALRENGRRWWTTLEVARGPATPSAMRVCHLFP